MHSVGKIQSVAWMVKEEEMWRGRGSGRSEGWADGEMEKWVKWKG